jgi:hypothetical protein
MRRIWLVLVLIVSLLLPIGTLDARRGSSHQSASSSSSRSKRVHVRSYTRKDGTVVKSHTRSYPKTKARKSRPRSLHTRSYSTGGRDSHGRIKRSEAAKHEFMKQTGYPHGRPGYVVDHIVPLACGGADDPSNMQWQTKEEARAKDSWERRGCK